jgi:hypothetical protein
MADTPPAATPAPPADAALAPLPPELQRALELHLKAESFEGPHAERTQLWERAARAARAADGRDSFVWASLQLMASSNLDIWYTRGAYITYDDMADGLERQLCELLPPVWETVLRRRDAGTLSAARPNEAAYQAWFLQFCMGEQQMAALLAPLAAAGFGPAQLGVQGADAIRVDALHKAAFLTLTYACTAVTKAQSQSVPPDLRPRVAALVARAVPAAASFVAAACDMMVTIPGAQAGAEPSTYGQRFVRVLLRALDDPDIRAEPMMAPIVAAAERLRASGVPEERPMSDDERRRGACLDEVFQAAQPVAAEQARQAARRCTACGKAEEHEGQLMRCGRCRAVAYCGAACQTAHWQEHCARCAQLRAAAAAPTDAAAAGGAGAV